jgi:cardiolipin synthase
MVDGYSCTDLSQSFIEGLLSAGVKMRVFDPVTRLFGQRIQMLRRMHRKLVVVDGELAFVVGINFSADHLSDFGPMAKQDYAVAVRGDIVADIHRFVKAAIAQGATASRRSRRFEPRPAAQATSQNHAKALFVTRDNHRHRNDIERHYLSAIRNARRSVLIANAYFFPGYRLLRHLTQAAKRGVDVHLILQGEPDMPIVRTAAALLYGHLQRRGVKVHEYCKRPLHGKVAVVDDDWSTVGSSNLDPLSLSLNLEANLIFSDAAFARTLRDKLEQLILADCKLVPTPPKPRWAWLSQLRNVLLFHVLRRFPTWAQQLPQHAQKLHIPHFGTAGAASDDAADAARPSDRVGATAASIAARKHHVG